MPTSKGRTPAAWRSQVPPEVRSLARGAADLKGNRNQSGPRAKPADRNRQGTNLLAQRPYRRGSARDDLPQPVGTDTGPRDQPYTR